MYSHEFLVIFSQGMRFQNTVKTYNDLDFHINNSRPNRRDSRKVKSSQWRLWKQLSFAYNAFTCYQRNTSLSLLPLFPLHKLTELELIVPWDPLFQWFCIWRSCHVILKKSMRHRKRRFDLRIWQKFKVKLHF